MNEPPLVIFGQPLHTSCHSEFLDLNSLRTKSLEPNRNAVNRPFPYWLPLSGSWEVVGTTRPATSTIGNYILLL
jgi:hypothetical protein